jgi:hypothetical protein
MQKTLKQKLNKSTKYIWSYNLNEFEKPKEWQKISKSIMNPYITSYNK